MFKNIGIYTCLAAVGLAAQAQEPVVPIAQLQQQAEQRQQEIDRQQAVREFAPSAPPEKVAVPESAVDEPCLGIEKITLQGAIAEDGQPLAEAEQDAAFFARYLSWALSEMGWQGSWQNAMTLSLQSRHGQKSCLGSQDIEALLKLTQNAIIDAGWITTRVQMPEQDLRRGELMIAVLSGKRGETVFMESSSARTPKLFNIFPGSEDDLLSLRDIEQGLENLRRLPTVQTQIDIAPSAQEGRSDLQLDWQQNRLYRFNVSVDDSGSKATGKYLGALSLSLDNPLRLSDILSLSFTHNLVPGAKKSSPSNSARGRTRNMRLNYSVPFGYWALDLGGSHYDYDQAVAGQTHTYLYGGTNTQFHADVSRTLYRDANSKLTAQVGLWQKTGKSFVDDTEIPIQRRRQSGWQAGVSHIVYWPLGTLESDLRYRKGTGAFSALEAPEEAFGEGSARTGIWTTDIRWQMPLAQKTFAWDSRLHGQWSDKALIPSDRISIGGRYSVRGFSGETVLSGDNGWYLRNDFQWHARPFLKPYLALDVGRVSGPSSRLLPGKTLAGAALGVKGQLDFHGSWYYDIFLATPLKHPDSLDADKAITGFYFYYGL